MKAIIRLNVPEWQIGQKVKVYFPDTFCLKGTCEEAEERPKGKWIEHVDEKWGDVWHTCSNCGVQHLYKHLPTNYCPKCGADMRGD